MRKKIIFFIPFFFILFISASAQNVGIGINTPHPSAQLDIFSTSKGLLIPRNTISTMSVQSNPARGLMFYDTVQNKIMVNTGSSLSPNWQMVGGGSTGWSLTGNSGINPASNFIGTLDDAPIGFRINNNKAGIIDSVQRNTAIGYGSMAQNSSAGDNTAFGAFSLNANSTGYFNSANGVYSLFSNSTGFYNTANGANSLYSNTSGGENTAIGYNSLYSNTNGYGNSACGSGSLSNNSTGNFNIAMGGGSLNSNTTGSNNTAMGYAALNDNVDGYGNTANGYQSLITNTSGYQNTSSGSLSLYSNLTGLLNTAVGYASLSANTTGSYNTVLGSNALQQNITGSNNVAIGYNSSTGGSLNNTVGLGNSGSPIPNNNQVIIGNGASTLIGGYASWSNYSDARIKNNIREDVPGLAFINRLRPVTYNRSVDEAAYISGGKFDLDYPQKYDAEKVRYTGFIAQEVENAAKEAGYDFSGVHKPGNEKDLYSISYSEFVMPLVKAVQEQQAIINDQQNQINDLRIRLEKLESK